MRNIKMLHLCAFISFLTVVSGYKLEQVVILSRHNIRTPLAESLEPFSTNPWPKWKESGVLTEKGAKLERYLGEYISNWLHTENLLSKDCINDSVYIYANTKQRTKETAKAFVRGAFDCNVTVHSLNTVEMDPVFSTVLRNKSNTLRRDIIKTVQDALNELNLVESYNFLEDILDLKNSVACKKLDLCSFNVKDQITYKIGEELDLNGPLRIGNAIVDSFLMSYYEGLPLKDIAWGKIKTDQDWRLISKITKENQNIRFNVTIAAKEISKPLIHVIKNIFEEGSPKFTMLIGHDSNLNSVMSSMGFKYYVLPDQYETTPVGGKLVFQKWSHESKTLLKVNFLYLTTKQLREGTKVSPKNPPGWVELEISECPKNKKGFCRWNDFMQVLRSL